MKLKEANRQRTFIAAIKDLDFWLGEVESLLNTDEHGKDLASVQNLMKKHQLVEADIMAHEDRIKDMNEQVGPLIEFKCSKHFLDYTEPKNLELIKKALFRSSNLSQNGFLSLAALNFFITIEAEKKFM